jgi:hypothetical protein
LADLYNYEIEAWRAEAIARVETQEDRKARSVLVFGCGLQSLIESYLSIHDRIMERAYALRDARENERKAIVKQKYDAQWRDACDDARTLDSKAMTIYMNQERIRQIEEKKSRKQQLSVQENDFVEEWNRQMDALAARDEAKRALRRQIDSETSAKIREQVSIWDMV